MGFGGGELGPHLTQCGQGQGLPACEVSSWSVKPFGHNTPTLQTGQTDSRAVATFEATEAAASVVFRTVASVKAITATIFSEREWVHVHYMLSPVRLSVVYDVRAPYSGGSNFRQYFYGFRYLGHPLTSTENFTEIIPGEPLRRGS